MITWLPLNAHIFSSNYGKITQARRFVWFSALRCKYLGFRPNCGVICSLLYMKGHKTCSLWWIMGVRVIIGGRMNCFHILRNGLFFSINFVNTPTRTSTCTYAYIHRLYLRLYIDMHRYYIRVLLTKKKGGK